MIENISLLSIICTVFINQLSLYNIHFYCYFSLISIIVYIVFVYFSLLIVARVMFALSLNLFSNLFHSNMSPPYVILLYFWSFVTITLMFKYISPSISLQGTPRFALGCEAGVGSLQADHIFPFPLYKNHFWHCIFRCFLYYMSLLSPPLSHTPTMHYNLGTILSVGAWKITVTRPDFYSN